MNWKLSPASKETFLVFVDKLLSVITNIAVLFAGATYAELVFHPTEEQKVHHSVWYASACISVVLFMKVKQEFRWINQLNRNLKQLDDNIDTMEKIIELSKTNSYSKENFH